MKPSDRINEILEEICKEKKCAKNSEMANDYGYQEHAIIKYLDEQWEVEQERINKLLKDLKPM